MFVALLAIPIAGVFALTATWRRVVVQAWLSVWVAVANLGVVVFTVRAFPHYDDDVFGGWPAAIGIALRRDALSSIMLLLTAAVMVAASLYQLGDTHDRAEHTQNPISHLSFSFILLALNGVFLTRDFFNFYVFFELLAVSSYVLVATGKSFPVEAAWKYAVQSTIGSTCLLVGVALIYAYTGDLNMDLAAAGPKVNIAAPFILTAFLLKASLFPFHLWQQDAHAAASSPGSAILAGLLIKVGIYGTLRFSPLVLGTILQPWLLGLGATSIIFGAVAAWRQTHAKRLLGFSSVSQMGFVLVGLGLGTHLGTAAALLFMIHHSLSKALLFLCTGVLADHRQNAQLDTLRGLGMGRPWLQARFLIAGFSLVGLPPTVGLLGKLGLLSAALAEGRWLGVLVLLLGSLMTLGYVVRMHRVLFWAPQKEGYVTCAPAGWARNLALSSLALAVVLAAVTAEALWSVCLDGARAALGPEGSR